MRRPAATQVVVVRVVTTYDEDRTTRTDLVLAGNGGVADTDGVLSTFSVGDLWPTLREALPDVGGLRADPRPTPASELTRGGAELDRTCRAVVATTVAARIPGRPDTELAVRTWLVTGDADEAVYLLIPGEGLQGHRPGGVAEHLIWDVTGALEELLRRLPDGRAS